jgi:predicted adenylyl cyclase CyaB
MGKEIEIEIKLPLKNPAEVKRFLDEHAQPLSADVFQKDVYYVPAHRDFLGVQFPYEWLRLRKSAKEACITYKHYYP